MPDFLRNLSLSRNILPIIAVIGLLCAAVFIWSGQPDRTLSEPEQNPPRATGALAQADRVAGAGVVEPSSEIIDIGSAVAGLVMSVAVQPGDFVAAGAPLFTVDGRAVQAQLREAEAAIAQARAAMSEAQSAQATARQQLALYANIDDAAAVSQSEVIRAQGDADAARARLEVARAQLGAAQARAGSARTELSRLTVRAPIAGEILAVDIRPGEFVSTSGGGSLDFIRMGETRPLHVRIDIDESEVPRIALGSDAIVSPRGAAERQIAATFVRAEPLVVPKRSLTNTAAERVDVRVMQVIYALPESAREDFRVGQQIDAFIPARKAEQGEGG